MAIPLHLWSCVAIGFHGFILVVVFVLSFHVWSLGNWSGKRKFNGTWGALCGT